VQDLISLNDVFAFGSGLDIAAAILLTKGLLLSTRQIRNLSATRYAWSAPGVVARVEDKVAASIGLTALGLGFFCQLIGYVLGSMFSFNPPPSGRRSGTVVLLSLLAIGLVLLVYWLVLPLWRKRLIKSEPPN
jgi:hypothetical protein